MGAGLPDLYKGNECCCICQPEIIPQAFLHNFILLQLSLSTSAKAIDQARSLEFRNRMSRRRI